MRRKSSSDAQKEKLRRGLWSPEEDEKLCNHITSSGVGCWSIVPKQAGLRRCGKSCRLRWVNYLRPDLKRGNFTQLEEDLIIKLHEIVGNRWSQIAAHLPGRTDNEIKNYWNSNLKKKLKKIGIDPNTHKPLNDERKLHNRQEKSEQHLNAPSKPPFNPFPVFDFNRNIGATNMGLYNQFQASSTVGSSDAILDTFLVPNLGFSDDNVSGLSVSYANDREIPSNRSNLSSSSSSSSSILQENEEAKVIVQKNATSADEYTSFQSMLATSLDEMFFFDTSAGELELELNGDFF